MSSGPTGGGWCALCLRRVNGEAGGGVRAERRCDVCFSPEADLVGGIVVTAIGVDACRHLRQRNTYLLVAVLPLLLGFHQLVEAFVWWGARVRCRKGSGERRCGSTW